jgi:hypothetical protein
MGPISSATDQSVPEACEASELGKDDDEGKMRDLVPVDLAVQQCWQGNKSGRERRQ